MAQGTRVERHGMLISSVSRSTLGHLVAVFLLWKSLLLALAIASPGSGYDTSTTVLLDRYGSDSAGTWAHRAVNRLGTRLTRWDAVYFTSLSQRGHVYEQDWAFSWALTRLTSMVSRVLPSSAVVSPIVRHALIGAAVSNISHLLAVLLIYRLAFDLIPSTHDTKQRIALTAALLHVFSPGGLFLSSFNGECAFAMLNFLGMLLYLYAVRRSYTVGISGAIASAMWTIASSLCFGGAAVVRSNGLLSGLIFAWDATTYLPRLLRMLQSHAWVDMIRLGGSLVAGLLLAVAFAAPQIVAFVEFCTSGDSRIWCNRALPSIYTWVQEHYWNVGFLRYWTLSNLPLFALAAPMLLLLLATGWVGLHAGRLYGAIDLRQPKKSSSRGGPNQSNEDKLFVHVMARLALLQIVLAVMAATSFHVQIINRICTGYPVWYIALAIAIHAPSTNGASKGSQRSDAVTQWLSRNGKYIVRAMVIYAIVQGGLYAAFLPPA